jgi:hypothetical protein
MNSISEELQSIAFAVLALLYTGLSIPARATLAKLGEIILEAKRASRS